MAPRPWRGVWGVPRAPPGTPFALWHLSSLGLALEVSLRGGGGDWLVPVLAALPL